MFALLSPNDAGKTTLVRTIATLTWADAGALRVAGHDVRTEGEAVRWAIGLKIFRSPQILGPHRRRPRL